ncbi:hypothetical protein [Schlesneria paludicola]|uniref:hypothetical protein n=1 Tax=Schlesneria paludicola TaxID=360056 RepID=UPI000299ECEA|nr:hypothetical protein [Schlesneria paludicola]
MLRPVQLLIVSLAVASLGCGNSGRVKVYPASGTVSIDGKPARSVKLILQPKSIEAKAPPASGAVADDGGFRLTTYQSEDGVAEGEYFVLVRSDPMKMAPVPTTGSLTIEIKRDSSGRVAPLKLDLASVKGEKPTIGAALPTRGGNKPAMPKLGTGMSPPPR